MLIQRYVSLPYAPTREYYFQSDINNMPLKYKVEKVFQIQEEMFKCKSILPYHSYMPSS